MPGEASEPITRPITRTWALVLALACMPALVGLALLGRSDKGLVAYFSIATTACVAKAFWHYRRRVWFWLALLAMGASHALGTIEISFKRLHFPAVVLIPIGLADFAAFFAAFWYLAGRLEI